MGQLPAAKLQNLCSFTGSELLKKLFLHLCAISGSSEQNTPCVFFADAHETAEADLGPLHTE